MAIKFNDFENINEVFFNLLGVRKPVSEIYINIPGVPRTKVWPEFATTVIYYKYNFLGLIDKYGVHENAYELHISGKNQAGYKAFANKDRSPAWQNVQDDVLSPSGIPYATPMSFVKRVVIDDQIYPEFVTNWFNHLYGGLNDIKGETNGKLRSAYPFEWVNFNYINIRRLKFNSLKSMFKRCHAPYVDLSAWNTYSVTDMTEMFNSSSLEHVYIGSTWNTNAVTKSADMFSDAMYLPNYSKDNKNNVMYAFAGEKVIEGKLVKGYLEEK